MHFKQLMKIGFRSALVIGLLAGSSIARAGEQPAWTNQVERLSYSIGMNIGMNIKQSGFEVDVNKMTEAVKDVLAGRELKLTEAEAREVFNEQQRLVRAKQMEARMAIAKKNREDGE